MSPERLAEIRSRYTRTTPDKPLWQEVCIDVSDLLREVDRLAEWLDVAAAAENANAKDLRELRDLIALHGPVGAGNEADTLASMAEIEQLRAELLAANEELRLTALAIYGEDHDAHELHVGARELRRHAFIEGLEAAAKVCDERTQWREDYDQEADAVDAAASAIRLLKSKP